MSGIEPKHLLDHVIRPALRELGRYEPRLNSPTAERLLLLTAAHESGLGRWLVQRGNGPAKGIFQMERPAATDAFATYCRIVPETYIDRSRGIECRTFDLRWAAQLARLYYWPFRRALPDKEDIDGLAHYWHDAWCRGCAGTVQQAASHYREKVLARIGSWD